MSEVPAAAKKAFAKVCAQAASTSAGFKLLESGDRVLLALSGGLDSFVMLEVICQLARRTPFKFTVECATFDPGFPEMDCRRIAEYCRERQIIHHRVFMDIPQYLHDSPQERFRRPCVWCSRMRRGKLYGLARELGASKLALGHHADDLMESFFISLVRGQGLTTMGPNVAADCAGSSSTLRIIRPLAEVPEQLVKTAAGCFDFPAVGECPYKEELAASGDRMWAKQTLKSIAKRIPDLHSLMLKSMGKAELQWLLDKRYLEYINNQP
ncbi:MAG: hypothetical protein E7052_03535 [Lentisphaerae bacterium]|nr:hypothetical protein [Lentisphaerota bacterium]